jgi:hypothetical protein
MESKTWKCCISNYANGGEVPVTITKTVEMIDESTQRWREVTVFIGDLTRMTHEDIMDSMARQERSSQYGGQRYVARPQIVSRTPICTVMVQEGGLDI